MTYISGGGLKGRTFLSVTGNGGAVRAFGEGLYAIIDEMIAWIPAVAAPAE